MRRAFFITLFIAVGFVLFSIQTSHQEIFEQQSEPKTITEPLPQSITPQDTNPPLSLRPTPKAVKSITPLPAPIEASKPLILKPIAQSELYQKGLLATINFLCQNSNNTYTVATGAIINHRGYIIANAHIIDKENLKPICTVRGGSPAVPIGKAKLVFVPPDYFVTQDEQAQARLDISLWKLEGTRDDWPVWDIDFDTRTTPNEQLLTQSYPAELLSNEIILKSLGLLFSNTIVSEADGSLIASRSTISAQHGSSGGILIDPYTGKLRGIIFGIGAEEKQAISERFLYAITPSRINAIVWKETGKQFGEYLATLPESAY